MGCGKSITRAYVTEHVNQLNEGTIPSPIVYYLITAKATTLASLCTFTPSSSSN